MVLHKLTVIRQLKSIIQLYQNLFKLQVYILYRTIKIFQRVPYWPGIRKREKINEDGVLSAPGIFTLGKRDRFYWPGTQNRADKVNMNTCILNRKTYA
jgi:hypothetical protein